MATLKDGAPFHFVTQTTTTRWDLDIQGISKAMRLRCCMGDCRAVSLDDARKEHGDQTSGRLHFVLRVADD
jgi:hypothetical protein